jgi:hypothetical protein
MGIALAIALAAFAGAHLAIVIALAARRSWWKALGALLVLPLAPWWGWQERLRPLAIAWLVALGAYAALVVVAAY